MIYIFWSNFTHSSSLEALVSIQVSIRLQLQEISNLIGYFICSQGSKSYTCQVVLLRLRICEALRSLVVRQVTHVVFHCNYSLKVQTSKTLGTTKIIANHSAFALLGYYSPEPFSYKPCSPLSLEVLVFKLTMSINRPVCICSHLHTFCFFFKNLY